MLTIEQSYQYLRGNNVDVRDYLNAVKKELCSEVSEKKHEGDIIFPRNSCYLIILTLIQQQNFPREQKRSSKTEVLQRRIL